jgi:hypothetical protein
LIQPAGDQLARAAGVFIGYSFADGVDDISIGFPADQVVDPLTRAVEYVPAA